MIEVNGSIALRFAPITERAARIKQRFALIARNPSAVRPTDACAVAPEICLNRLSGVLCGYLPVPCDEASVFETGVQIAHPCTLDDIRGDYGASCRRPIYEDNLLCAESKEPEGTRSRCLPPERRTSSKFAITFRMDGRALRRPRLRAVLALSCWRSACSMVLRGVRESKTSYF